ncbi:MAG TPA: glutamate--tRNA ligase, partial [Casimicrobiaceae bacterium]
EHLKRLSQDELARRLVPYLERAGLDPAAGPAPEYVAMLFRDRVGTLTEMADAAHYFYAKPHPSAVAIGEQVNSANLPALVELLSAFESVPWTREAIGAALKATAKKHGLKPPQIMMATRLLVCGTKETPAIDAVLALLGRETTRSRLADGLRIAG